ncbi:hypothetical protein OG607_41155 [Streptomyces sp. NBC_01537]|uniref:hypothetical protein n=1 Tax=Streptomyces sp. NBC_01537 TaxID=2903896 RepID=UPI0038666C8B
MGNLADDCGTDVEIYHRAFGDTIYADSRTGAPERLLALLDRLGLQRRTEAIYVWHEVPEQLTKDEQKRIANGAIPALLVAGYTVNIPTELFDQAAYSQAADEIRAQRAAAAPAGTAPAPPATSAPPPRRST